MIYNGGTILGHPTRVISGGGIKPGWFDAGNPVESLRALDPGDPVLSQQWDRLYSTVKGSSTVTDFIWNYIIPAAWSGTVITRSSSDESVIIPDPLNPMKWIWVSDGSANITLQSSGRTLTKPVTTATTPGQPITTFTGYDPLSLRYAIHAFFNARAAATEAQIGIFNDHDTLTPIYIRNPNCWAHGVDFTPKCLWNSDTFEGASYGPLKGGVLISPRHILHTVHFPIDVGSILRFYDANGFEVRRTMIDIRESGDIFPAYPDLRVGLLDSDVPETINFARILPDNYINQLPLPIGIWGSPDQGQTDNPLDAIPGVVVTYLQNAVLSDLAFMSAPDSPPTDLSGQMVSWSKPRNLAFQPFYVDKVPGDSGSPCFLIVDSKLILTNTLTSGGGGKGTSVVGWKDTINALMADLGTEYQLTAADISAYKNFSD